MNVLHSLQSKVGFTRKEAIAIITLSSTFLAGLGIRWLQKRESAETPNAARFTYAAEDSMYAASSEPNTIQRSEAGLVKKPAMSAASSGKKHTLTTTPINLNTATKLELTRLPGIGESYADRIIAYRATHGRFISVDELSNVKGIGVKKVEQLRPFVSVK
jgi:comEA protein